jgi:predicted acylesterase/phospholipase RssA
MDGGGTWSIIQIKALKHIFGDLPGREILKKFDLVAANSGGSIVAAGLAENYRPSELEQFFKDPSILNSIYSKLYFRERSFFDRITLLGGMGPRYSTRRKYDTFLKLLPQVSSIPMHQVPALVGGENPTHFLIVAFDYNRNRSKFFRSDTRSKSRTATMYLNPNSLTEKLVKSDITLTQAVHTSTNAPINYFDAPALLDYDTQDSGESNRYWDGAVGGYNNPVLSAIVETVTNGVPLSNIQVLSIGTGHISLPFEDSLPTTHDFLVEKSISPSFVNDVLKMTTAILGDPPDAATYVSYAIMYPDLPVRNQNFVRLNPILQPNLSSVKDKLTWTIPEALTANEFQRLANLDFDATDLKDVELLEHFANLWLADKLPNQPIRNDKYMKCLLGHETFSQGWNDVLRWSPSMMLDF